MHIKLHYGYLLYCLCTSLVFNFLVKNPFAHELKCKISPLDNYFTTSSFPHTFNTSSLYTPSFCLWHYFLLHWENWSQWEKIADLSLVFPHPPAQGPGWEVDTGSMPQSKLSAADLDKNPSLVWTILQHLAPLSTATSPNTKTQMIQMKKTLLPTPPPATVLFLFGFL